MPLIGQMGIRRCTSVATLTSICDQGAEATDLHEGNLDRNVLVCGQPFRPVAGDKQVPVMLACRISPDMPGNFNLTYSVRNSAGVYASTWRQLTIRPVCPPGERLCDDRLGAERDGGYGFTSSLIPLPDDGDTTSIDTNTETPNLAPVISLVTSDLLPKRVKVKRGLGYTYCNGMAPVPDALCEPGATATDPDGDIGGTPLDISSWIVACPPPACLSGSGCPSEVLNNYRLTRRGIGGCGIDPMAPVGTVYSVTLWVWDADRANASVVRHVEITDPCPVSYQYDSAQYLMCKDLSGRYYCSPIPCDQANRLRAPYNAPPIVALVADVAYIEYGDVPPYYMGPCKALPTAADTAPSSCGAYALAKTLYADGRVEIVDLSQDIMVTSIDDCAYERVSLTEMSPPPPALQFMTAQGLLIDSLAPLQVQITNRTRLPDLRTNHSEAAAASVCNRCPLELLHLGGKCPPGTYQYVFSVKSPITDALTTTTLTVHVYFRSSIRGTIVPFPPYSNATRAYEDMAAINATISALITTAEDSILDTVAANVSRVYREAMSNISYSLQPLPIDDSDIVGRVAWLAPAAPPQHITNTTSNTKYTDLYMDVEVFVHEPAVVHAGLILDYKSYAALMTSRVSDFLIDELSTAFDYDLAKLPNVNTTTGNSDILTRDIAAAGIDHSGSNNSMLSLGKSEGAPVGARRRAGYSRRQVQQIWKGAKIAGVHVHGYRGAHAAAPFGASLYSVVSDLVMELMGKQQSGPDVFQSSTSMQLETHHRTSAVGIDNDPAHAATDRQNGTRDSRVSSSSAGFSGAKEAQEGAGDVTAAAADDWNIGDSPGDLAVIGSLPAEQLHTRRMLTQEDSNPPLPPEQPLPPDAPPEFQKPPLPPMGNLKITSATNVTGATVPIPGSLAALILSLEALVASLKEKASVDENTFNLVQTNANISLSDTARVFTADAQDHTRISAFAGLLADMKTALNVAVNGSQVVLSTMDQQLSVMAAKQEVQLYETTAELTRFLKWTEAQAARIVYDTMVIEEATGLYQYAWVTCPGLSYTKPREVTAWAFRLNTYSKAGGVSGSSAGAGAVPTVQVSPLEEDMPTVSNNNTANHQQHLESETQAAFSDRRLFRSSRLVGGVLLHAVRRPFDEHGHCTDPRADFSNLNFDCVRHYIPGERGNSSSFLKALLGGESDSLGPYGVDPVFLKGSSMYDIQLADKVSHYYNTTSGSAEVSPTGAPHLYFHRPLQGLPDGFPVLLPNSLREERMRDVLTYLKDSNFLDRFTRSLIAELLVFSSELRVFGHMTLQFTWSYDGRVHMNYSISGLPALTYLQANPNSNSSGSSSLSSWSLVVSKELMGLWLLSSLFAMIVAVQALNVLRRAFTRDLAKSQMWTLLANLLVDMAVAGLLLASSAMCSWYMISYASAFSARQHYQVYDGIHTARARWLLPRKVDPWDIPANSTQAEVLQSELLAINITDSPSAGSPGRYLLPDHPINDLDELAGVLATMRGMEHMWTTYGIMQSVTLVLLIGRLLSTLAFQDRMGSLVRALYHIVPPLVHLMVLLVLISAMLGAMALVVLGTYVGKVSTLSGAIESTLGLLVGEGVLQSFNVLLPANTEFNGGQHLAASMVLLSQVFLLTFMLIKFFFSVIVFTFRTVKTTRRFTHGATMWEERIPVAEDMAAALTATAAADSNPGAKRNIQVQILTLQALQALLRACANQRHKHWRLQQHQDEDLRELGLMGVTPTAPSMWPPARWTSCKFGLSSSNLRNCAARILRLAPADTNKRVMRHNEAFRRRSISYLSPPSPQVVQEQRPQRLSEDDVAPHSRPHALSALLPLTGSTVSSNNPMYTATESLAASVAERLMLQQGQTFHTSPEPTDGPIKRRSTLCGKHGVLRQQDAESVLEYKPPPMQSSYPGGSKGMSRLKFRSGLDSGSDGGEPLHTSDLSNIRNEVESNRDGTREGAETTRLLALFGALNEFTNSMQKWQAGVQRWQLKIVKQQDAMRMQNSAIISSLKGRTNLNLPVKLSITPRITYIQANPLAGPTDSISMQGEAMLQRTDSMKDSEGMRLASATAAAITAVATTLNATGRTDSSIRGSSKRHLSRESGRNGLGDGQPYSSGNTDVHQPYCSPDGNRVGSDGNRVGSAYPNGQYTAADANSNQQGNTKEDSILVDGNRNPSVQQVHHDERLRRNETLQRMRVPAVASGSGRLSRKSLAWSAKPQHNCESAVAQPVGITRGASSKSDTAVMDTRASLNGGGATTVASNADAGALGGDHRALAPLGPALSLDRAAYADLEPLVNPFARKNPPTFVGPPAGSRGAEDKAADALADGRRQRPGRQSLELLVEPASLQSSSSPHDTVLPPPPLQSIQHELSLQQQFSLQLAPSPQQQSSMQHKHVLQKQSMQKQQRLQEMPEPGLAKSLQHEPVAAAIDTASPKPHIFAVELPMERDELGSNNGDVGGGSTSAQQKPPCLASRVLDKTDFSMATGGGLPGPTMAQGNSGTAHPDPIDEVPKPRIFLQDFSVGTRSGWVGKDDDVTTPRCKEPSDAPQHAEMQNLSVSVERVASGISTIEGNTDNDGAYSERSGRDSITSGCDNVGSASSPHSPWWSRAARSLFGAKAMGIPQASPSESRLDMPTPRLLTMDADSVNSTSANASNDADPRAAEVRPGYRMAWTGQHVNQPQVHHQQLQLQPQLQQKEIQPPVPPITKPLQPVQPFAPQEPSLQRTQQVVRQPLLQPVQQPNEQGVLLQPGQPLGQPSLLQPLPLIVEQPPLMQPVSQFVQESPMQLLQQSLQQHHEQPHLQQAHRQQVEQSPQIPPEKQVMWDADLLPGTKYRTLSAKTGHRFAS
ncbi:hypothetical protein VOLCADRAFT_91478 [Volvox carteri f. nagariensis]|uniref:Polycystin cation channel PKD1/PKD2 domain-containing protein n=1 Tax=Volvox carteri f. nagariensis TaxID=3068 RepID=D8TX65_VOLCA|nr:uncharacterized protein VOLCADRAFT_91478 [Volvox carteri f. nagariensis]EFJ47854.1 hypothetical protein VOLCADRAFT_91478 [Volvox carteri f. nagariensis]|eukprot:XP_002950960.1 hypothetical protein VOLCADRAFT_91478 [Volvox carteri f. nagariensis]